MTELAAMTDDEYVDAITAGLNETKAWTAQFVAAMQQATDLESDSDVVAAAFDEDGYLRELFIDPIVPAELTHTELEELLTTELRGGCIRQRDAMRKVVERYFGPASSWREIKALQEDDD